MNFVELDADVASSFGNFNKFLCSFAKAASHAASCHFFTCDDLLPARVFEAVLQFKDSSLLQRNQFSSDLCSIIVILGV